MRLEMYRINLDKSPRVKKLLQAQVGEKTDLSQFAVFELRANDTLPITRAGGLLANSRMSSTYLSQMAEHINKGNYVPVIQLHQTQDRLPSGRILDAKVYDNEADFNQKDLHLLIYLQASDPDASKIDSGIINEVSTGTTPKSVKCSACDFDFYGSEDNRKKLWAGRGYTPLCDNGHQWGMNGNHLKLDGMKEFREISIVTRGAVPNAQVIKAENVRLAAESDEINLSAKFNADILLSTVADAKFLGFEKPADLVITPANSETGANMDIQLSQEKYDQLIKNEAKIELLESNLQAEKETAKKALEAKVEAESQKAQAEANFKEKETEVVNLTTERDDLQAQLTAANAKLAVYEAGGKPDGSGSGKGAGDNDDKADFSQSPLDTTYFKAGQ